jgi:RimJ/RimL family protein N-acetyltransferase
MDERPLPRIDLVPLSPPVLLALIDSVADFERVSGLRAADGLRDFYVSGDVSAAWLAKLRESSHADPWVHGFGVRDRATDQIIGSAGFKGAADAEGMVEIGYGIVPRFQGQGFASEAAAALIEYARNDPDVRTIRAHTAPESNASTRVLAKCGFVKTAEVDDPEDGPVWRWERRAR